MKTVFEFKAREEVSPETQLVYDNTVKQIGFVPNMYRVIAHSVHGLGRYVRAEFGPNSLSTKEQEIVNLVVSEVNKCLYCTSFHFSYLLKLGLTEVQLQEVRKGLVPFDARLQALVSFTKSISELRGHIDGALVDALVDAGYNKGNIIDIILLINFRAVTNYVHTALGEFEIDFPLAPPLA